MAHLVVPEVKVLAQSRLFNVLLRGSVADVSNPDAIVLDLFC